MKKKPVLTVLSTSLFPLRVIKSKNSGSYLDQDRQDEVFILELHNDCTYYETQKDYNILNYYFSCIAVLDFGKSLVSSFYYRTDLIKHKQSSRRNVFGEGNVLLSIPCPSWSLVSQTNFAPFVDFGAGNLCSNLHRCSVCAEEVAELLLSVPLSCFFPSQFLFLLLTHITQNSAFQ